VDGLGLVALDHPLVREAIRRLAHRGISVVTLASDVQNVPRLAYVGIDNRRLAASQAMSWAGSWALGTTRRSRSTLAPALPWPRGARDGIRSVLAEEFPASGSWSSRDHGRP
jgi:LacI family transcriptional regulator